ncbi:MAG: recombinase family protein [bacterium]|nr:recombinase family protein [bacterium]
MDLRLKKFSISESASGHAQRRTFNEMLALAHRTDISAIIVEKVDRLTRSLKHAVIVNDWIDGDARRRIHFVKQSCVLSKESPSHEKLFWNMQVMFAQHYINNLSEEVKKGHREKIAQGWLPTKPPLGYMTVGDAGHKIHVPDPIAASLIQEMFELYAASTYSLTQLVETMHRKGLRTRDGNKLVKSRLASLLKDPFYCGTIRWKGALFPGKHEPLISHEPFDEVQRIKVKRTNKKYLRHNHLFKGLMTCIECGGKITWEEHKQIVYGHCNHYRNCTQKKWHKEKEVEQKIVKRLELYSSKTAIRYSDCTPEEKQKLLKKLCKKIQLGDKIFELLLEKPSR